MTYEIIIPIITALIGVAGGIFTEKMRSRSNKQESINSKAIEIVKLELERAKDLGRSSPYSVVAHWAVLKTLIEENDFRNLGSADLTEITNSIHNQYMLQCWPDGNKDAQDIVREALENPNKIDNSELLDNIRILVNQEASTVHQN